MPQKKSKLAKNLVEKTEDIAHKAIEVPKQKIEHIKQDAKQYYKGKNMITRYIIIGFLFILLVLQFILPKNHNIISQTGQNSGSIVSLDTDSTTNLLSTHYDDIDFLGFPVNPDNMLFDEAIVDLVSDLPALTLLYKKSSLFLPDIAQKLQQSSISTDFQYLAIASQFVDPIFDLPDSVLDRYGILVNDYVDERLNTDKMIDAFVLHIGDLNDQFGDTRLALLAYLLGGAENLQSIMDYQHQSKFEKLYISPQIMSRYYSILAYKYIWEHIDDYIDIANISYYTRPDVHIIKVSKISDLLKWATKNHYSYKEIKELNPWILQDSLPKGNREIAVYGE